MNAADRLCTMVCSAVVSLHQSAPGVRLNTQPAAVGSGAVCIGELARREQWSMQIR